MGDDGHRIIMRNEKTHHLLLNFRIFKKFIFQKKEEKKMIFSFLNPEGQTLNYYSRVFLFI
jgi:uncharacterized protein YktA (UPF0223 family)